MDTVEGKRELRARILAARRARGRQERERVAAAVRDILLEHLAGAGTVACYYSVGGEPGTRELVEALRARGTRVLLPVFLPGGDLDWVAHEGPGGLAPAGHGLVEPVGPRLGTGAVAAAAAVVCPALAVDRRGVRLGRGAGCYDRALSLRGPDTAAVAVVHDEEFVGSLPAEPHDVPVDAVVTPGGGLHVLGDGEQPPFRSSPGD
ncbi:5-formyltetrahydrofolate cyclo-ligase [Nocardiopsis algeriensis]|uniref:5-formyltetrahydrofolate cyclo-ligase n=1 Tax=Nocardiopsis algeriensis TaxID=1478215 RepID=A0A841ILK9_9ACTN|nr:5-formyltetrahydrofolate cyclo-ligase [Nocardiopsis algeriensis]MBB6118126.1 5-formyltetrahydrofolate cyclo-ligase [Nocardiopsis algeriensis]